MVSKLSNLNVTHTLQISTAGVKQNFSNIDKHYSFGVYIRGCVGELKILLPISILVKENYKATKTHEEM